MPKLYTVPMPDTLEYRRLRRRRPTDVIPMPGEPVVPGDMHGDRKVWASNGQRQGWYHYGSDTFTSNFV